MHPVGKLAMEVGREKGARSRALATPHATSMAVWDIPVPITPGREFKVKVGVSCASACDLSGERVEVRDSGGRRVAAGRLSGEPFPKTDGLYWTEVRLKAPRSEGYREWTAQFLRGSTESPHRRALHAFGSMEARPGLHLLTVRVTDGLTKAPISRAYVRLGANTFFTDDLGVVKLTAPREKAVFVVWARSHKMQRTEVEVTRDTVTEVALAPSPCKYCPDST